jgi:hypothetical protein
MKSMNSEELMSLLPQYCQSQLPFVLSHKSGISKDLLRYISTDALSGKSLEEVGKLIGVFRTSAYLDKRVTYSSAVKEYTILLKKKSVLVNTVEEVILPTFSQFDDPNGYNEVQQLDNSSIRDIFVEFVKEKKEFLDKLMTNASVPFCISIDSTFRIRKHTTSYNHELRKHLPADKNAYSLIMSGEGQIVNDAVGTDNQRDFVELQLEHLRLKCDRLRVPYPRNVYVDDCCMSRKMIHHYYDIATYPLPLHLQ